MLSLWVGISLLPRLSAEAESAGGAAGTRPPEPPRSRGRPLLYLFSPPAARTQGRLARAAGTTRLLPPPAAAAASTAAGAQHASRPGALPPRWLPRPTFREGGREHAADSRSPDARLNHSYGGRGEGGERMGDPSHQVRGAERGPPVEPRRGARAGSGNCSSLRSRLPGGKTAEDEGRGVSP